MATRYGPYEFSGVVDCGRLIDAIDRDVAAAKAKSRADVLRMLEHVKQGHADWLRSHNLKGRTLRRAGSPFSHAYDDLEAWLAQNSPARKPRSKSGFVYFITQAEHPAAVKIGFAVDVNDRLGTLQTSSHVDLTILASFPGTVATEKQLHRKFADDRLRGEWFRMSEPIRQFIEEKQRGQKM